MADLDGDGCNDLITGCFEGGSYIVRGLKDGGFAKPEPVLDASRKPLRVGQYWDYEAKKWTETEKDLGISATPVDWDADGDLDLLLGTLDDRVYLSTNEGSAKKPAFAKVKEPIEVGGKALEVPGHHAMPVVADWDDDGKWDLVSGSW